MQLRILLFAVVGAFLILGIVTAVLVARFQPVARSYIVSALRERYNSDVELGDLRITLFPSVHAVGENLVLRFAGRPDLPPMVRVRSFTIDADFVSFFRSPKRIGLLRLDGLEIHTPPKSATAEPTGRTKTPVAFDISKIKFVLDEVVADGSVLATTPSDPSKDPLVFRIPKLTLRSVGIGRPMTFVARVENPEPPGLVDSEGEFGPWNAAQPSDTPLSGHYTFRNANLGVFKGIAGTLSSEGKYSGQLARLEVHGTTDIPDFALDTADHPMHLTTEFDATVDGTNGNTVLHPVRAHLGSSAFEVSGSIARGALEKHKAILFDAKCTGGRLEDLLRLTVKGPAPPPLTGRVGFHTSVKIPPGEASIADRVELDGTFALDGAKFTDAEVESKMAGLSHRAQGDPKNHDPNVTAEFNGAFHLRNAWLALPNLDFELPGAHVTMTGGYGLRSGALNFDGTVRLDAKVSQMTTGIKSLLLRPVDRIFERDGAGTVLPIRISGTRGDPTFKLDIGKILRRK
jgi:hypothetical protein